MAVREIVSAPATSDRLFLGATGASLSTTGFGMLGLWRLVNANTEPLMGLINGTSAEIGTLYYDGSISFGNTNGDVSAASSALNTTDVWLIGVTMSSAGVIRFHWKNVTTGAATVHAAGGTLAIVAGTWDHTELCSSSNGTFNGTKRVGMASVFTSVYADADFDGLAMTTQAVHDLATPPNRLWDVNQAAVTTAVVNLMTGSSDQNSRTGTTVVTDTAFNNWTFGISGGGPAPIVSPLGLFSATSYAAHRAASI